MNKHMKKKIGLGAAIILSVIGIAFVAQSKSGPRVPVPSKSTLVEQCMNSAFDYVEKQSPEYCKCYAENYPALAGQIKEMQGKNADEISKIVEKGSPMDKCEPLRARDFQKEAQVVKQQFVSLCMQGNNPTPAYCECTATYMTQRSIEAMKAHANTKNQQDDAILKKSFANALDAEKQCEHLRQAASAVPQQSAPPDSIKLPDHYDLKDENGNVVRLPMSR